MSVGAHAELCFFLSDFPVYFSGPRQLQPKDAQIRVHNNLPARH